MCCGCPYQFVQGEAKTKYGNKVWAAIECRKPPVVIVVGQEKRGTGGSRNETPPLIDVQAIRTAA